MKVLVTGASGFIGSEVTKRLCRRGFEVHAASRTAGTISGAIWHQIDLLDSTASETLISKIRPTHLVHLAWCTAPGKFWHAPENRSWEAASRGLFDSFTAHGGKRFIGAGSCAEYEWNETQCLESDPDGSPATLYGQTKLSTWNYVKARDVESVWGRIFWLYGPNEHTSRLIPQVINGILHGNEVKCTSGEQVRDFMHVFDVAEAFVRLTESGVTGAINIASGEPVSVRDIVIRIADTMSSPHLVKLGALEAGPAEPNSVTANVKLLGSRLQFEPSIGLQAGLTDTISWWKSKMAAERSVTARSQ